MRRILPGIGTLAERKKFAIFHTCTLILSPAIGAFFVFIITCLGSLTSPVSHLGISNPFENVCLWLLASLFCWTIIGSIRFYKDIFGRDTLFIIEIFVILAFGFPFLYLHNLWYIFSKKNTESSENINKKISC